MIDKEIEFTIRAFMHRFKKEPEVVILHYNDCHKLDMRLRELSFYPPEKPRRFMSAKIIRTEDIEEGTFKVY
jgi:hypothetical protein